MAVGAARDDVGSVHLLEHRVPKKQRPGLLMEFGFKIARICWRVPIVVVSDIR